MRYVIAVVVLAILISKLLSVVKSEQQIMMDEIREAGAWLDAYNKSQIETVE